MATPTSLNPFGARSEFKTRGGATQILRLDALKKAGFSPEEQEIVTTTLVNRVGTLAEAAQKLGQGGVDIQYCYMTVSGENAVAVFATNDNKKAAGLI